MPIANQMGDIVEVDMPWSTWGKLGSLIAAVCGVTIAPIKKGFAPDFIAWFEVTTTEWECIQKLLDDEGAEYMFRDLSESAPIWRRRPLEKNELDA